MVTRGAAARGLIVCFAASLVLSGCGPAPATIVRSAADLHCSLPIYTEDHVGFVEFPSGQYRDDPNGPSGPASDHFGLFYDAQPGKWVTTENLFGDHYFSPDGTYLAQLDPGPIYSGPNGPSTQGFTDVYLLTVQTQTRVHVGVIPGFARLIAFGPDGIYMSAGGKDPNDKPIQSGIYRFDPHTGQSVRIGPNGPGSSSAMDIWFWMTPSTLWGSLSAGPNQFDSNPVQSMSRANGRLTTWYTAPKSRSVAIVGFVGPLEPLVAEFDTASFDNLRFMVLTAPNSVKQVKIDPSTSAYGLTDRYGIWLSGPARLSLYDNAGLIAMADLSRTPIASETPVIAGRCY